MPEAVKTTAPVAAKTADAPAPKPVAATAPAAAPPKAAPATPAKAAPVVVAKAAPAKPATEQTAKPKRGRPLGAKSKPKPAAASAVAVPAAAKAVAPKIAPKIIKNAVAPLATSSEGSRTMNDTITTMQDTAKKFTGEASARAKGAYEKGIKLTEEFTEFQKGNVEAMVESSKLAAKAAEKLGQETADYARKSFESGSAAFKSFAAAKSPTELFKLQSDYVKSYFDSAIAESSKVTEAWLKIAGEVVQPLSNRMAVAVDKVKVASAF